MRTKTELPFFITIMYICGVLVSLFSIYQNHHPHTFWEYFVVTSQTIFLLFMGILAFQIDWKKSFGIKDKK